MKPSVKKIAIERMYILANNAISVAKENPILANRYAELCKKISTKHKIRMPYELRILYCKKCKSFIVPGLSSRIRIGRSPIKSIRITCSFCGHVYRKLIPQ